MTVKSEHDEKEEDNDAEESSEAKKPSSDSSESAKKVTKQIKTSSTSAYMKNIGKKYPKKSKEFAMLREMIKASQVQVKFWQHMADKKLN